MRSLIALAAALLLGSSAAASPLGLRHAIGSGALGAVHESFDGMGPTGTTVPGAVPDGAGGFDSAWSLQLAGASPAEQHASLGLAPALSIDAYNGGAPGGADRALGLYTTATGNPARSLTARFGNETGAPLSELWVQFDVEYWIQRSLGRWAGIQVWLSLDGVGFVNLGNGFESTRTSSASTGWVDGNAQADRGVGGLLELAAQGLAPIPAGSDFFLRFDAAQGLTVPSGMSVQQNRNMAAFLDELWVGTVERSSGLPLRAVPEPGTGLLLALGLAALRVARTR